MELIAMLWLVPQGIQRGTTLTPHFTALSSTAPRLDLEASKDSREWWGLENACSVEKGRSGSS